MSTILIDQYNIKNYCREQYSNITKIIWQTSKLNELVIKKFTNLRILCSQNSILTTLKPLSICRNLQELNCKNNYIKTLKPLINCHNLQILNCYYNQIKNLKPLFNKIK